MDDVLRQVVGIFAQELEEQTQKISQAVLAMEADPAAIPTQIEELYRQAHSLKGSSASLGVTELEKLAHSLEELLLPVRRHGAPFTAELADLALRAVDVAQRRGQGLVADSDIGRAEALAITEELRAQCQAAPVTAAAPPVEAPAAALPVVAPPIDDGTTLRVAASRLATLERRLDELRTVRGRLDHRSEVADLLLGELTELWHYARAESHRGGDGRGADRVYQALRRLAGLRRELIYDAELAQASLSELDSNLRALRMVPFSLLREPLQRAFRDACRRTDKEARLVLNGGEQELDRRLLDELKHPLLHLVRNAVDHGLEPQVVREALGKPARAEIEIRLEQRGADVVIEVRDDGRGINVHAVRAKAVQRGLLDVAAADALDERGVYALLFQSGFSTAETVTELSGRGVGLDVAREAVERLQGRIEVESRLGAGTCFRLTVPLTIAGSETMLVRQSGRTFAIPQLHLERIVRAPANALHVSGSQTYFHLDDQPLPVIRLARLLGLGERHQASSWLMLAVVRAEGRRAAVLCERLLGSRDLVLRPLPPELGGMRLLDAVATLPDGQPILVLSARALLDAAEEPGGAGAPPTPLAGTVLVADDSITTRALLRHTLEASGYAVRVAGDGDEALRLALSEPIDLVVTDIRMPRLDGFELTSRLKGDPRTARLPVVLLSTHDSEDDRTRGTLAGASAYVTKRGYEPARLVDLVSSLLRGAS